MSQQCRSCGAPIRWAHTEAGKVIPLDADPVPDGNVTFTGASSTNDRGVTRPVVRVEAQPSLLPPDGDTYVSHFVTCPDGDTWRRK